MQNENEQIQINLKITKDMLHDNDKDKRSHLTLDDYAKIVDKKPW